MTITLALLATLVSACALNVGYLLEHRAVRTMPAVSARRPWRSLRLLLSTRSWLLGFGVEACGWLLFVVALALAPLSLVQATAAGGIGILAVLSVRLTLVPLSSSERLGVVVSIAGLALLGISLAGGHAEGGGASTATIAAWIAVSAAAAAVAVRLLSPLLSSGAGFGLATGLLFASGDVATKAAVEDDGNAVFVVALIGCYAAGTLVLQAGFQHGAPLATAGLATLLTNALPIVAGMTIFAEPLPTGWLGGIRIAAFTAVVTGGVFLAERKHGHTTRQLQHTARADSEAAATPTATANAEAIPRPSQERRRTWPEARRTFHRAGSSGPSGTCTDGSCERAGVAGACGLRDPVSGARCD